MRYTDVPPLEDEGGKKDGMTSRERVRREREYLLQEQYARKHKKKSLPRIIFGWIFEIAITVLFAYVLVHMFGQVRTVSGDAMETTLVSGDRLLLNTIAYEIGSPKRGDIISFKPKGSGSAGSEIKRVVGLPGETVQIIGGMVYIDGQVYLEQADYPAITNPGIASEPVELGENEYFVLGDNRNNSIDSRSPEIGSVSSSMIEGKCWFIANPAEHRRLL